MSADAQADPQKQLTDVESLLASGCDAIIILAQDSKAILPAIARAKAAGVPVVAYDAPVDSPDVTFASFDNVAVGHLMAVPYKKTGDLASLGGNEIVELWHLVVHGQELLRRAARAQGFNVGLNLDECAGAGVADHLHIHIVPRWKGDTNFMPVIAGTKTISEGLRALYDKLIVAQEQMEKERAR